MVDPYRFRTGAKTFANDTIQFHGAADIYVGDSRSSAETEEVATLYEDATPSAGAPAVLLKRLGAGNAAVFAYDLARSVVYTRQGNPAWSGMERDGIPPMRPDDLFYGVASNDIEPDWVDLDKVAIPQADEQQRLLANLILDMNAGKKPLPRFWYFPRGLRAGVIMTGDDHGLGRTSYRFDSYLGGVALELFVKWVAVHPRHVLHLSGKHFSRSCPSSD